MEEQPKPTPLDEYDIGDLGPPLDLDDEGLTPKDKTRRRLEIATTDRSSELITPRAPEFLNDEPFRRRMRVVMEIQNINNHPVVLPKKEFAQAMADYELPLFGEQLREDEGLFWEHFRSTSKIGQRFLPYVEGQQIGWPEPDEPQTELSFIINNLPDTDRKQVEQLIAAGHRVSVSLIWGPKDKITKFGDKKVAHYQYPQPPAEDKERAINLEREFWGTNYLAFTKVRVDYDQNGDVRIAEVLLAEANIGSKTGSYVQKDRWGHVVGAVDRTLPGLIRRNTIGDKYLPEEQRLYNQCADLEDKIPAEDKPWVRRHFIEWIKQHLDPEYKVNHQHVRPSFFFDEMGSLTIKNGSNPRVEYPKPLRINVGQNGYLARVLLDLAEHAHAESRLEKHKLFETQYYPLFKAIFVEQGPEGLAKVIMLNEDIARYILKPDRSQQLRNLAYLVYFFATDKELPDRPLFTNGLGTAEAIISALETENTNLIKRHSLQGLSITATDWESTLTRVRGMMRPRYFSRRSAATWLGELQVGEPKLFYYPSVKPPQPDYVGMGKQFKRWIKPAPKPADHYRRPKKIWGFDIFPPETTPKELQDKLAGLFIEYVSQIGREGMLPNTYALHRDRDPRIIQGQEVDGNYFYNRARVLWRDMDIQAGQSSQYAIKRLFKRAQELLDRQVIDKAEQARLHRLLDYEQMSQISDELKHITGRMGEIFTWIAIETNLLALLNIKWLTDQAEASGRLEWSLKFVDMDHRVGEGAKMIESLNLNTKQKENVIPDFVVDLNDIGAGKVVRFLIDSKAYLKPITKDTAENIAEHYRPLLQPGIRLIIVSHSSSSTINQKAKEVFAKNSIILCHGEDVARVLDMADSVYRVPPYAGSQGLGKWYDSSFKKHPGGFAAREVNGILINQAYTEAYRAILRGNRTPNLFSKDTSLYYKTDIT